MPYIGNTVQTQGFTPAIDYFSGNGVTVTFTLSRPVVSASQMIVAVDNVVQNPSTAFTVSGSSITFTSAPLSGTNNIWVEYTSLITTYNAISQDPSVIGDLTASGGFLSTGDFGNSYIDGTIVDYVTGNARITTGPADGLTIYNGGTTARTALAAWDQNGNMGLGTTSPIAKLDVRGAGAYFYDNSTTDFQLTVGSSVSTIGTTTGTPLAFKSNSTERMRITSAGYTQFGADGTTSTLSITPTVTSRPSTTAPMIQTTGGGGSGLYANAGQLIISGRPTDTSGYGNIYVQTGATQQNPFTFLNSGEFVVGATTSGAVGATISSPDNGGVYLTTAATVARNQIRFANPNGAVGSIQTSGTSTSYNTSSDYRLKEDIAPMQNALDTVSQLKPVTYKWKADGSDGQGFIAHELQAVMPDCVTGEKDAVDKDGNPEYQGIDTSFLVATLTAAIQEQQAMIEELKTKVAALEAK